MYLNSRRPDAGGIHDAPLNDAMAVRIRSGAIGSQIILSPRAAGAYTDAFTMAEGTIMPMGTRHEVVGMLLESRSGLVLEIDGGGTWRLEAGRRAKRLLGHRVQVVGVRDGFDLLAVERIDRA